MARFFIAWFFIEKRLEKSRQVQIKTPTGLNQIGVLAIFSG